MKREFIERVKNRLVYVLEESQMQELEMAITICLDGLQLQKECTELSTEVVNNWEYCKRYLQYLIVSGKSKGTIGNYGMHLKLLFEDARKPAQDVQHLAGHASPDTTMIYCSIDTSKVKAEHKMYLAA